MQSISKIDGKPVGFRVEYHPIKDSNGKVLYEGKFRAHINVFHGKADTPHFLFQGDQNSVNKIVTRFLCK